MWVVLNMRKYQCHVLKFAKSVDSVAYRSIDPSMEAQN